MMRVLLVEDDPGLGAALRDHVVATTHAVDWSRGIEEAEAAMVAVTYDLLLLDIGLPDGSGLDLLRAMRLRGERTPVIILTARDRITERIAGLDAGADDYLVKPFDLGELSARIGAVTRRAVGQADPRVVIGNLEVDVAARRVNGPGGGVDLTLREWTVLEALLRRPGQVVSKARLEESLYAFEREVDSNAVEAAVSRLRRKLGENIVETRRGLGYRLRIA
jgi:two-component system OmpR family response regulator